MSDILSDKHELRRLILRTTPLWKAKLFAKYGNESLLNELQKEAPQKSKRQNTKTLRLVEAMCKECNDN